jgi:hypothetical protein
VRTGVPVYGGRMIVAERIELVSESQPAVRDLTPFASVSASSHVRSDRWGQYQSWMAVDGSRSSAWVEGAKGLMIREVNNAATTPTTTAFEADAISPDASEQATADHYNSRLITFTSGALKGQQTNITDYAQQNSREYFTVTALTEAPANGDRFIIH